MEQFEKIVKIIENNSPELAAEEILHLFSVVGKSAQLCDHPRSERTYIGQNMLRCNKCGKEFS